MAVYRHPERRYAPAASINNRFRPDAAVAANSTLRRLPLQQPLRGPGRNPPAAAVVQGAMMIGWCRHHLTFPPLSSLHAGVQVLLSIGAGWLCARAQWVDDADALSRAVNAFVMKAAFPAFIIHLLGVRSDLRDADAWR